jgi:hypothetical protein
LRTPPLVIYSLGQNRNNVLHRQAEHRASALQHVDLSPRHPRWSKRLDHGHPFELKLGEAAHRFGDSGIVAALTAAEAEAARMEALDHEMGPPDARRGLLKLGAYYEADHQRWQLVADMQQRLLRGELVATARERPAGPRIDVSAEAWLHLHPHFADNTARDGMDALALYDVRVTLAEAASAISRDEIAAVAPVVAGEPSPVYSVAGLRAWYMLRCRTWPATHPAPSEADDLAAAAAHFGMAVPRDPFRTIRRELAPAKWKKPGPRQSRA